MKLDWNGFMDYLHESNKIDVLETNPEKTFVTVENINNTDPAVVAEMFTVAHDCDVYVGSFDTERSNGKVDFYP